LPTTAGVALHVDLALAGGYRQNYQRSQLLHIATNFLFHTSSAAVPRLKITQYLAKVKETWFILPMPGKIIYEHII